MQRAAPRIDRRRRTFGSGSGNEDAPATVPKATAKAGLQAMDELEERCAEPFARYFL